jgi:hypothetical protein
MKISHKTGIMEKINCNNHEIKVESFKYLGSKTVANETVKEDITEGIKNSGKFYQLLRDILWKCEMSKKGNKYSL